MTYKSYGYSDGLKVYRQFCVLRNNKPYDSHVHLPRPLTLNGQWSVSLLETCLPSTESETDVYIYSNLCEDTIVGDKELPLLRRVYLKRSSENQIFKCPYEVSTRLGQVLDVHIYIKDADGQDASFLQRNTSVTLLLKWKSL